MLLWLSMANEAVSRHWTPSLVHEVIVVVAAATPL